MSLGLRRLVFGGLFVAIALGAVAFAAVAGAATAPMPDPEPPLPSAASVPEDPDPSDETAPPRRYVAIGSVVAVREDRVAIKVRSRDAPIVVAVRPRTAVRINMKKAELAEIERGDHVVVVGRPGPRGNLIARAIVTVRKAPTPQATEPG